jgi:ATP-dependent Clp protease ATP-binding subunit ClpC
MLLGNLSENAEKVLAIAAGESEVMNHFYIGTEHLFIGLCKVEDMAIKEIFQEFNIDPRLRRELRARVGEGSNPVWGKEMILTPRVRNISKIAEEIAKTYRARQLEPIHLLLALLRGGDGVAVRMLKEKGIDLERMRSAIEEQLEQAAEELRLNPSAVNTPFLNKIGRDLTFLARQGKIDPVIGRKEEIKKIAQILSTRKKNNPVLVGEAGVGKTAVVEGLALRLIREDIPE